MLKVAIIQIQLAYDPKNDVDVLYGLDPNGNAYWYRHESVEGMTDDGPVLRTSGWVRLNMVVAEEKLIKKETENNGQSL